MPPTRGRSGFGGRAPFVELWLPRGCRGGARPARTIAGLGAVWQNDAIRCGAAVPPSVAVNGATTEGCPYRTAGDTRPYAAVLCGNVGAVLGRHLGAVGAGS
jgi:hypothetical protein